MKRVHVGSNELISTEGYVLICRAVSVNRWPFLAIANQSGYQTRRAVGNEEAGLFIPHRTAEPSWLGLDNYIVDLLRSHEGPWEHNKVQLDSGKGAL